MVTVADKSDLKTSFTQRLEITPISGYDTPIYQVYTVGLWADFQSLQAESSPSSGQKSIPGRGRREDRKGVTLTLLDTDTPVYLDRLLGLLGPANLPWRHVGLGQEASYLPSNIRTRNYLDRLSGLPTCCGDT
ncbi:hypothetical protein RRG08_041829 [Elysia crispata]|uniref:Uncharacterized protein n=1 Tax=Elysia crispata TaxID=231223 RepID=A0AAE0Y0H5_9GAST|nr:hypothetical protein RRG08_041829 [Elysia crispata]